MFLVKYKRVTNIISVVVSKHNRLRHLSQYEPNWNPQKTRKKTMANITNLTDKKPTRLLAKLSLNYNNASTGIATTWNYKEISRLQRIIWNGNYVTRTDILVVPKIEYAVWRKHRNYASIFMPTKKALLTLPISVTTGNVDSTQSPFIHSLSVSSDGNPYCVCGRGGDNNSLNKLTT